MPAKVIVRDLRKNYGATEAVNGVSFEVEAAEIFGILGPNGAGKTTTIECITGLRDADSGYIEIAGIDAGRQPSEAKQKIGAALQTTSLQDKITPREALRLFGSFYRDRCDAQQLLDRFSLTEKADAPFDSLSGGQRQRLALALAFLNKPEVIFLDEPSSGLDPQARRDLHNEILRMKQEGYAVLLTTHNIEEAERLCDRIAIIDHGRVIAQGPPSELIASSAAAPSVYVATIPPLDAAAVAALSGVMTAIPEGAGCRFSATDITGAVTALMRTIESRGLELSELRVQKATLEDVLLRMTGGSPQ